MNPAEHTDPTLRRSTAGAEKLYDAHGAPTSSTTRKTSSTRTNRIDGDDVERAAEDKAQTVAEGAIDVAQVLGGIKDQVDHTARNHPYTTIAAAAGLGYVLGGGLPSWVVRTAVNMGTRAAVTAAVASLAANEMDD